MGARSACWLTFEWIFLLIDRKGIKQLSKMMIMIKIISQSPKYAEIQILILKWLDAWHFGKGLLCLKWKSICRHTQILHFRSLSLRKKGPFAQLRGTISGPLRALKDFQMRSYLLQYKLKKIYICFWAKYVPLHL